MPKLQNPLPQALPKECAKAAKICTLPVLSYPFTHTNAFTVKNFVDSGNNGLDGVRVMSKITTFETKSY